VEEVSEEGQGPCRPVETMMMMMRPHMKESGVITCGDLASILLDILQSTSVNWSINSSCALTSG
jgi:hypothetical protein